MLVGNIQNSIRQKRKDAGLLSPKRVPLPIPHSPSEYMSPKLNNIDIERPLKNNSENLSFKGLSFMGNSEQKEDAQKGKRKQVNPTLVLLGTIGAVGLGLRLAPAYKKVGEYSVKEFKNFAEKHLGPMGEELLDNLKNSKLAKDLVKVDGDKVTVFKKTIPQLIWDGMIYPFKILPGDIANGAVELLGKIKPLKNWSDNALNQKFFKDIRQTSKMDAKVNALRGLLETKDKLTKQLTKGEITQQQLEQIMFQHKMKMFDTSKGNYDTKHERTLVRIVSGLPPAIFLANDAYNLSRILDDDAKNADKEKRTRFSQEAARVGLNAYITLVTMGALQKYINNSKFGNMLLTASTTLFSESISRFLNGKQITRMTPEQARRDNEKNNMPEASIKPVVQTKKDMNFKGDKSKSENKEAEQKPLLTFETLLKASAVIIAGGYAIKGARKMFPALDKGMTDFFKSIQKKYKNLTDVENHTMPKEEFDKIIKLLKENGQDLLVKDYEKIAALHASVDSSGKTVVNMGPKSRKYKPIIKFIKAPFEFVWNAITLPFNITEKIVKVVSKSKLAPKTAEEIAKDINDNTYKSFAKSLDSINKEIKKTNFADTKSVKKFRSFVSDNFLKGFNVDTMSNVSNCDLSNLAKIAGSAATLWFLMTDNYNMVMLKSNGNDVKGAETKFKERFVQEISRLFYQTLLIDLFNSTFSSQYHKSFFGVTWITLTNTTMGEWLTRKSVGVSVGTHSRKELIEKEEKQNNAKGFLKNYYDFMRRLTGKRSVKSYNVSKTLDKLPESKMSKSINEASELSELSMRGKDKNVFAGMMK